MRRVLGGLASLCLLGLLAVCACIDVGPLLGGDGATLFPPGSFVIRGRMGVMRHAGGECPVFRAETGINYTLFQNRDLDNDLFDAVTTSGAVSRLEVQRRTDLETACVVGEIVEIQEVLELIPAPGSEPPEEN